MEILIAVVIAIIIVVIVFVYMTPSYHVHKSTGPQPDIYKATDSLDYLVNNTYCGVNKDHDWDSSNHGPLWKRAPLDKDCGTSGGQQDFWYSGTQIDSIVNLVVATGKATPEANKVLDGVFESDTLLYQLMNSTNGAWNDDRLWFTIDFIRLYQFDSKRFPKGLDWATQVFNEIHTKFYDSFVCNGKTYTSTWWHLVPRAQIYRNTITNSLLLVLAARLYEFANAQDKEKYWKVIQDLIEMLMPLKIPSSGLMGDGWGGKGGCSPLGGTYTYNQGVLLDGFVRAAKIYQDKKNFAKRDQVLAFTFSLISTMTEPVPSNPMIAYNGKHQPILYDLNSPPPFKGVYCKYLAYAVQGLVELPLNRKQRKILWKAKKFISQNAEWVYQNGLHNKMYPYEWQLTKSQVDKLDWGNFLTATTFSAIDLFTTDYILKSLM